MGHKTTKTGSYKIKLNKDGKVIPIYTDANRAAPIKSSKRKSRVEVLIRGYQKKLQQIYDSSKHETFAMTYAIDAKQFIVWVPELGSRDHENYFQSQEIGDTNFCEPNQSIFYNKKYIRERFDHWIEWAKEMLQNAKCVRIRTNRTDYSNNRSAPLTPLHLIDNPKRSGKPRVNKEEKFLKEFVIINDADQDDSRTTKMRKRETNPISEPIIHLSEELHQTIKDDCDIFYRNTVCIPAFEKMQKLNLEVAKGLQKTQTELENLRLQINPEENRPTLQDDGMQ